MVCKLRQQDTHHRILKGQSSKPQQAKKRTYIRTESLGARRSGRLFGNLLDQPLLPHTLAIQGLSEMLSPAFFCQDPEPIRHRWLVPHV